MSDTITRIPRLRTASEAYACIKAADPDTAVSANYVRGLIVTGKVPQIKCGKKYLVDLDALIEHLNCIN